MPISEKQSPKIFSYTDYRDYLKDLYDYHKQTTEGFSYRKFSAIAGFKSPNALKLVIDAQRNLTVKSLNRIAKGFELSDQETRFFKQLVLLNQARTPQEKQRFTEELLHGETFKVLYPLKVAQYDLYRRWYTVAIREMMASSGFKNDPQWIASQFQIPVTAEEVKRSLENLLLLGLIEKDSEGRLRQSQQSVATGNEVDSTTVMEFHRKMIELGSASLENTSRHQREVSSSTLFLTEKSFQKMKSLIQDFRRSLLALEQENEGSEKAVYQVNFQAFPLTRPIQNDDDTEQDQENKSA